MTKHKKTHYEKPRLVISDFMPQDAAALDILHKRAELFAKQAIEKIQSQETVDYLIFNLEDNEKYGIEFKYIKEVIDNSVITKLPRAAQYIAGVINRRGILHAVVDLKQILFHQSMENIKNTNIIIVTLEGMVFGILAHEVENSSTFDPKTIEPALPTEAITKRDYILGLDKGRIAILNIESIILDLKQQLLK